ncbi:MAG: mandelate racemase/muconate lactonizing enzyme family protein [Acidobacteriota bacterium]
MNQNCIDQVDVYVLKLDQHYRLAGHEDTPGRLPGTDYFREPQWRQAYSAKTETCLVKVTTAGGVAGWGEAQAPITPEAAAVLVEKLLGPAVIGEDALATEAIYERLYHLMSARGQQFGFYLDAMGAIDTALWDIRGKVWQAPVCSLLGGPFRTELPAYISGLRRPDRVQRLAVAQECMSKGFAGVKIFSGLAPHVVMEELHDVRHAIGPQAFLGFDAIQAYGAREALEIGMALDGMRGNWLEAPVGADDIAGHARLAGRLATPIAAGEHLRSVAQFLPWLQAGAIGVAQPDVVRCGISAARKIANLAQAFHVGAALHLGVASGIGAAATWQLAAALPNFVVQEHQLDLFDTANRILREPLRERDGMLQVPLKPGLGIEVDEAVIQEMGAWHCRT